MISKKALPLISLFYFVGAAAHADITTQLATVNNVLAGGIPPVVSNVSSIQDFGNLGGSAFGNQYTSFGFPGTGDRTRNVGAVQISGYNTTGGLQPFVSLTNKLTAIFAIDAAIDVSSGTPTATLELGRLNFYSSPSAVLFDNDEPSTWGFGGTLLASFGLKPQEAITGPGAPGAEGINVPADDVNTFATNLAFGNVIDGFAIFRDLVDPFIDVEGVPPAIPIPGFEFLESLIAVVDETVVDPLTRPIDSDDLDLLNAIALALGMPANIGGTAFATGLGGMTPTNFSQNFAPSVSGDLTTSLGLNFVPGAQQEAIPNGVIPEPSSILVWAMLIGCLGICGWVRNGQTA